MCFQFERFLQQGGMSVATVFAPIMFAPAPVLMFKRMSSGERLNKLVGARLRVDLQLAAEVFDHFQIMQC